MACDTLKQRFFKPRDFPSLSAGEEARGMYNHVNQTRLQILQTWSKGESAKELEAQLPG